MTDYENRDPEAEARKLRKFSKEVLIKEVMRLTLRVWHKGNILHAYKLFVQQKQLSDEFTRWWGIRQIEDSPSDTEKNQGK